MNDLDRRALLGAAGLVSVSALAGRAHSGPLDPPAGPVISTGKTLTEVEPRTPLSAATTPGDVNSVFRIEAPGSYYLTGNLSVPAARNGIKVSASNVTIDLNGFTISSTSGAPAAISAENSSIERVVVKNGYVTGTSTGVSLLANAGVHIEDLMVDSAAVDGIAVGLHAIVARCRVTRCGRYGFSYGNGAVFADCIARANGAGTSGAGFHASGVSSQPIGSVALTNCLAEANLGMGIHVFGPAALENCCATSNASHGFFLGQGPATVRSCIAQFNGSAGMTIVGGVIQDCYSGENTGTGIQLDNGVLRGCRIQNNQGTALALTSASLVQNNSILCSSQQPIAMRIIGPGNRIEGNSVFGGSIGIQIVIVGGNMVIGNWVSQAGTAFALPAGTIYGPIIDRAALASPAVNGSSAASVLNTTDPFANFVM